MFVFVMVSVCVFASVIFVELSSACVELRQGRLVVAGGGGGRGWGDVNEQEVRVGGVGVHACFFFRLTGRQIGYI